MQRIQIHSLLPLFLYSNEGLRCRRKCHLRPKGQFNHFMYKSFEYYKVNILCQAYLAYNSSNVVDNTNCVVSTVDMNGHVSIAFWCTKDSKSTSVLNRTSIFQRSLSPNTCRCESIDPSTTERGGQCCNLGNKIQPTNNCLG